MKVRREQLLASTSLTQEEHRRICGCNLFHLVQDPPDGRTLADDRPIAGPHPDFGSSVRVLRWQMIANVGDRRNPDVKTTSHVFFRHAFVGHSWSLSVIAYSKGGQDYVRLVEIGEGGVIVPDKPKNK